MNVKMAETPAFTLNANELAELVAERLIALMEERKGRNTENTFGEKASKEKKFVYGLRGIKELFNVSHATAQRYKDGILKPAVRQNGRKIVVDVDMALELFRQNPK